ncbi:TPM domain-containing protein [Geobacter pickeringii]|uniref:Beta-propeller domains of methanol dehydrogenase type n=1 Tax=Geobacter pickeringii TaxID=345632 RepID=A0A0B5BE54_9BACT|nr:TPM domain-containing protein [Geobacter pickeringii]AJE03419.1 beta-propeller domains of methanol dehydrogenase type [Geobacter pickeringii]
MKRIILSILLLCLLPAVVLARDVPPLRGYVNDYAGMISDGAAQRLQQALEAFERSDSTQIVVLTIPSLEGDDLEGFSIRVAEAWKIGQQGKDNGAILLVAKAERKVRIEVGRGLEGKLTDLVSGRIIRGDIAPRFKQGDFDGGVTVGVSAIMATVRGEYAAAPRDLRHGRKSAPPLIGLLIFLGVACVFFGAISRPLGALAGSVGLPVVVLLTFPGLGLVVLAGLAVAGFLLGLIIVALFGGGGRGGGMFWGGPPFGGGFGGGWSSGGGGFSGGGGDFGGGGASGDW